MHFFIGVIQKNLPKIVYFFRLLFLLDIRIRLQNDSFKIL